MADAHTFEVTVQISQISANDKETFLELLRTQLETLVNTDVDGIQEDLQQTYVITLTTNGIDDVTVKAKITEQLTNILRSLTTDSNFSIQVISVRQTSS